jgi:hypothetical protein
VPVLNRRYLLRQLLDALAAQTFESYEVVVVDDGSTDGAPEEAAADAALGRPVRWLRNEGAGAVEARRTGVEQVGAPYLAFTDSDCVPNPQWLEKGVEALEAGADAVQGLTRPTRAVGPLERSVWAGGGDGLFDSCNMFYRRSAYEAVGGFDRSAADRLGFRPGSRLRGTGFGEDTLLGWRVRRQGRVEFVPEAVVEHHVFESDVGESLRRAWSVGAFPALVREVPELRDSFLVDGAFLADHSRLPLYLALCCAVAGRPKAAAGASAAWAAARGVRARRAGAGRMPASRVALDLGLEMITAAALLAGSVRARTIVL